MLDTSSETTPASSRAERQYLERYAEPEVALTRILTGNFGHVIAVPAYDEAEDLVRMLQSVPKGPAGDVLIVLVVNATREAAPWVHERNAEVLLRLEDKFGHPERELTSGPAPARLFRHRAGRILHIDRASPDHFLPDGQGVGLARKIGLDLGLALRQEGRLVSRWLHSTDADVWLPHDYFDRAVSVDAQDAAAIVYPFTHRAEEDAALARAIALYEISLRYYVVGLAYAGSPYAHHTVGSTIAVDATRYAEVRGVPKRTAAEDFYLLAKIAKVGTIVHLGGATISLSGRVSRRVPFGTGPSVERIARTGEDLFCLYHPEIFRYLGVWTSTLTALSHRASSADFVALLEANCRAEELDPEPMREMAALPATEAALEAARRQSKNREMFARHLTIWFDAFRTLKFIHLLQARGFPPQHWFSALATAPFTRNVLEGIRTAGSVDARALGRINGRLAAGEQHVAD